MVSKARLILSEKPLGHGLEDHIMSMVADEQIRMSEADGICSDHKSFFGFGAGNLMGGESGQRGNDSVSIGQDTEEGGS